MNTAAPMRKKMAELIYGILEDFVEEEDEDEKSPVVEDLEKTCQILSHVTATPEGESEVEFITNDYRHLIKSFSAFRELLVAATSMAQEAVQQLQATPQPATLPADAERIAELEKKVSEVEESLRKVKEVAKTARLDHNDTKGQLRRVKNDNETLSKKNTEFEETNEKITKELKTTKGQLEQMRLQKKEAFTKSRKVQGEREAHARQIAGLKESSDHLRREMEMRMLATCKEQEEYTNVMCELRAKLEAELTQLRREHQLAEENNTALMEDRVNLIAQLTETKIEAQETLQRTVEEYDAKLKNGDESHEVMELKAKMAEMTKLVELEREDAEAHRQTCEKYRIDLEATLKRVSEMADEISRLEAEAAECEELRDVLAKQKKSFDRELNELQLTVDRMEQSAAKREAAMAERAEDALEKAISHARSEAHKQSENAISNAIANAKFQNEMMNGNAEDKLRQACQHIESLQAQVNEEKRLRFESQQEVRHVARKVSVERSEEPIRKFGSASYTNTASKARTSSPAKEESAAKGSMSWLKKMRKDAPVKENKENESVPASGSRRDKSVIKGTLQKYARGSPSVSYAPESHISPARKVANVGPSVSQEYFSPGMDKRQSAKMERQAALQRLKQRV